MKKAVKMLFAIIFLIITLFTFFACKGKKKPNPSEKPIEQTFYKLELGSNLIYHAKGIEDSDIDLNKIAYGTVFEITVDYEKIPNKEVDRFVVNGEDVANDYRDHNNKLLPFKITINRNNKIEATFKDKPVEVEKKYQVSIKADSISYLEPINFEISALQPENALVAFKLINIPESKKVQYVYINDIPLKDAIDAKYKTISYTIRHDVSISIQLVDKEKFKLTLPSKISVETPTSINLDEIYENTNITLKIETPLGHKIKSLSVNGNERKKDVKDDKIVISMVKNIEVKVEFEILKHKLDVKGSLLYVDFFDVNGKKYVSGSKVDYGTVIKFKVVNIPQGADYQVYIDGNKEPKTSDDIYTITMDKDIEVQVQIKK